MNEAIQIEKIQWLKKFLIRFIFNVLLKNLFKYFDYTMAGVEDIAGMKGKNSIRDAFERFNANILKPILMKNQKRHVFDASHILRAYSKITLQEALQIADLSNSRKTSTK